MVLKEIAEKEIVVAFYKIDNTDEVLSSVTITVFVLALKEQKAPQHSALEDNCFIFIRQSELVSHALITDSLDYSKADRWIMSL